jgi:hypothetical protein
MAVGAVQAIEIINDAFELIGVRSQGETLPPDQVEGGLRRLNQLIAQWSLLPMTMTATRRQVFPLVAGKGTPQNPYTIGPGGDLDTDRPTALDAVGILVAATPPFELTRSIFTDAAYQATTDKTLRSTYFSGAYLEATYAGGLAKLYLYPIPNAGNALVLYTKQEIQRFPNLTTPVDLPPGAVDAITYELGRRLAAFYQRVWSPDLAKDASDYLAIYKRANTRMVDLTVDAALLDDSAKPWDILSDS